MRLKIFVILAAFLVNGCAFHSKPEENLDFYQISQLSELAGVYKNKGNPSGYLSWLIFPDIKKQRYDIQKTGSFDIIHEDIEFIEVIPQDSSLLVKAVRNNCSIYEKINTAGRDSKIKDGVLIINREGHLLTRGGDDVLLGPSYESVTLGLDTGKHGKSRSSGYAAGLVFLVVPMAISGTTDIRYERVHKEPGGPD